MREIRFRAWDGQRFYYFDNHAYTLDYNDISGWNVHPNVPNYRGEWTTGQSSRSAETFDLQQFTGIKDKNKKWIYEGDILGLDDPKDTSRAVVVFHNGAFKAQLLVSGRPIYDTEWDWIVIGNKYDHPDLLETKGYRSVEPDELEIMMPVQVLTHKNRWESTYVVGFVRSDGLQQVELLDPYRKPGIGAASRITMYGEMVKSHIRVPVPTEDKEDES